MTTTTKSMVKRIKIGIARDLATAVLVFTTAGALLSQIL